MDACGVCVSRETWSFSTSTSVKLRGHFDHCVSSLQVRRDQCLIAQATGGRRGEEAVLVEFVYFSFENGFFRSKSKHFVNLKHIIETSSFCFCNIEKFAKTSFSPTSRADLKSCLKKDIGEKRQNKFSGILVFFRRKFESNLSKQRF